MTSARADAAADADRLEYLRRACGLLWPAPAEVSLGRPAARWPGARPPAGGHDEEFILLLGTYRPRLLVPAAPAARAAAVRGSGEPGSPAARLGARALSLVLARPVAGAALRSRVRVHNPAGADTIESFLHRAVGHEVLVSLYLGPARANRKPVLQLFTPAGKPAGFAKLGASPLSRTLVEAERNALARLGAARLPGVVVPRVRYYGEWRDMNVLVLSALPVWLRRRRVPAPQLAAAMTAVATVGGLRREPLAGGGYWRQLIRRLDAADASAERDALRRALGGLPERLANPELPIGSWHGDWTPWNMANTSMGMLVWDWERFTDGVPLGFDALHYKLQRDVIPGRREPRAAAGDCIKAAPDTLTAFGVEAATARLIAVLYLAELATRYLSDRQAETGARLGAAGSWLIPTITEEIARLGSS